MRKKFWICIKSLSFSLTVLLVIFCSYSSAKNGWIPVDDRKIILPDGRLILSVRKGDHSHSLALKKGDRILWERVFEEEYDRLWDYAFFVPIKPMKYSFDLNSDGFPEIAIATWDGGNNMAGRDALLFTVKLTELKYIGRYPFNLEYGESVFK